MADNTIRVKGDFKGFKDDAEKAGKDLDKSLGDKGGKRSLVNAKEKKFWEKTLKKEISKIDVELKKSKKTMANLTMESRKLKDNTEKQLEIQKKITKEQEKQSKLTGEKSKLQGGISGGSGMMGGPQKMAMAAAMAVLGAGVAKTVQGMSAYSQGVPDRIRMQGLGMGESSQMSTSELAKMGMTEQEFNKRRIQAGATLGKDFASESNIRQQSLFERSRGLEAGKMTGVATQLRGQFGNKGANMVQMKLQASIMSAGIEDSLAPYLDAMTSMLGSINDNGLTQTTDMIKFSAAIVKAGTHTPEQIAKLITTIQTSVKGSTGEANAFFQRAFSEAGIGGGTIGGTQMGIESGGILGLSQSEMVRRFGKDMAGKLAGEGLGVGAGERVGAVMGSFRQRLGMEEGQSFKDLSGEDMVRGGMFANQMFGTKGVEGMDIITLLEKFEKGGMSEEQFETELKDIKAGKTPDSARLEKINNSMSGNHQRLDKIAQILTENVGEAAQGIYSLMKRSEIFATEKLIPVVGAGSKGSNMLMDIFSDEEKVIGQRGVGPGTGKELPPITPEQIQEAHARALEQNEERKTRKRKTVRPARVVVASTAPSDSVTP